MGGKYRTFNTAGRLHDFAWMLHIEDVSPTTKTYGAPYDMWIDRILQKSYICIGCFKEKFVWLEHGTHSGGGISNLIFDDGKGDSATSVNGVIQFLASSGIKIGMLGDKLTFSIDTSTLSFLQSSSLPQKEGDLLVFGATKDVVNPLSHDHTLDIGKQLSVLSNGDLGWVSPPKPPTGGLTGVEVGDGSNIYPLPLVGGHAQLVVDGSTIKILKTGQKVTIFADMGAVSADFIKLSKNATSQFGTVGLFDGVHTINPLSFDIQTDLGKVLGVGNSGSLELFVPQQTAATASIKSDVGTEIFFKSEAGGKLVFAVASPISLKTNSAGEPELGVVLPTYISYKQDPMHRFTAGSLAVFGNNNHTISALTVPAKGFVQEFLSIGDNGLTFETVHGFARVIALHDYTGRQHVISPTGSGKLDIYFDSTIEILEPQGTNHKVISVVGGGGGGGAKNPLTIVSDDASVAFGNDYFLDGTTKHIFSLLAAGKAGETCEMSSATAKFQITIASGIAIIGFGTTRDTSTPINLLTDSGTITLKQIDATRIIISNCVGRFD